MKVIYHTENYSIHYHQNSFYEIVFANPSKSLIQSITNTNLILGATVSPKYTSLRYKASSIYKYTHNPAGIDITILAKMMSDISTQLSYLNQFCQKSFLGFSTKHLFCLDETTWIYLSDDFLFDITLEGKLEVLYPFNHTDFYFAPELYQIRELPCKLPIQVAYYSLALLIVLVSKHTIDTHNLLIQNSEQLLEQLYWKGTKFYYLIKRCLVTEPEKRVILFI
jgi:hypothetical protein